MDAQLIRKMQALVNNSTEEDVNKNIAIFILKNIERIDKLTISDIAASTFTSTASISRFSRNIGCENFNDLKGRICDDSNDKSKNILNNMDFESDPPLDKYIKRIMDGLNDMRLNINMEEIDALVKEIHDHEDVCFYGINMPCLLAQNTQQNLILCGKFVESYDTKDLQINAAKKCSKETLAIIFSMDGNFMRINKEVKHILDERGIKQILVTQNPERVDASKYYRVVALGKPSTSVVGRYKLQLFMDILLSRYIYLYRVNNERGQ